MTETYAPTSEDIRRIKPRANMLKISGDGVFATLQGEGMTAGLPAVFLRLQYCNLACGNFSGWKCDTQYAWDKKTKEYWQEPEDWTYQETASRISQSWEKKFGQYGNEKRLVVTGGEPLLQQGKIAQILKFIPEWKVEIETNGTISPVPELRSSQFNCSPKLSNSGNSLRARYKPEVLELINSLPNSWFKFVVTEPKNIEEIDGIVKDCKIDEAKILIMPEGQTAEEVSKHAELLTEAVAARNWKMTLRNQLIWYGPKRRT